MEMDIKELTELAESGDPVAQNSLGEMYRDGNGVKKSKKNAIIWFEKAAEAGNSDAQCNLGDEYISDFSDEERLDAAEKLFKSAAEQNNPRGWIGLAQLENRNEIYDSDKIFVLTMKAAELDYPPAMRSIGWYYENGDGVDQSFEKAMEWYSRAADGGDGESMYAIGELYLNGSGVDQSYDKAMDWYMKAVSIDEPMGLYGVAMMYEKGYGVEKSAEKAIEWYQKSADLGYSHAKDRIKKLQAKKG